MNFTALENFHFKNSSKPYLPFHVLPQAWWIKLEKVMGKETDQITDNAF